MIVKEYVFKKLREKRFPESTGSWYLCINTQWELINATDFINSTLINHAFTDAFNVFTKKQKHHQDKLARSIDALADVRQTSFLDASTYIMTEANATKLKYLNKGYTVYISPNLMGFTIDKNNNIYNILDVKISDTLTFPNTNNYQILQYDGGTHWYAEVGNVMIRDVYGNEKWDTYEEAHEVVKTYLKPVSRRLNAN